MSDESSTPIIFHEYQRVLNLRDAMRDVFFFGVRLVQKIENIKATLDVHGLPLISDYEIALFDPSKPYPNDMGPVLWPPQIRQLNDDLLEWHRAVKASEFALDELPRQLIDDTSKPPFQNESYRIRKMLSDACEWLSFSGYKRTGVPDYQVRSLIYYINASHFPSVVIWNERLQLLHKYDDNLRILQLELESRNKQIAPSTLQPSPLHLFISYAHQDERHRVKFSTQAAALEHQKIISTWHFRKIVPGQDPDAAIMAELNTANLVIFLLSPHFLQSGYCLDIEFKSILEKRNRNECDIVTILIDHCDWSSIPELQKGIQHLPTGLKPVIEWRPQTKAWQNVVEGIKAVLKK